MDEFLTCLAGDQIVDAGAAVNTVTWTLLHNSSNSTCALFNHHTYKMYNSEHYYCHRKTASRLIWLVQKHSDTVLTAMGVLGAVRLRKDRRCWLRNENLRMDSRLRDARERRELVLLKSPVPPSPLPPLSTEVDKKLSAPWKERRTFPTHPDTWEWATDSLSPRYSITTRYWQDLQRLNRACELSRDLCCDSSGESLESSCAEEVAVQGKCPRCSLAYFAGSILQQWGRWQREQQHSSASLMWWCWWYLLLTALQHR